MAYRNREGFWGFPVLAGVDHKNRFTMWSHRTTGCTDDSMSWSVSDEFERVKELPDGYFVIGDEAFRNTNTFLVPWKGHSITAWKSSFNFHLSSMRQCIERAFGILVARWLILSKPLQVAKSKWTLVSRVCAKLHNFLLSEDSGSCQGSALQFWNGIRLGIRKTALSTRSTHTTNVQVCQGKVGRRTSSSLRILRESLWHIRTMTAKELPEIW